MLRFIYLDGSKKLNLHVQKTVIWEHDVHHALGCIRKLQRPCAMCVFVFVLSCVLYIYKFMSIIPAGNT